MPITKKKGDARISRSLAKAAIALRVEELKQKVMDDGYLDSAIDRIASVVSKRIAEHPSFSERSVNKLM